MLIAIFLFKTILFVSIFLICGILLFFVWVKTVVVLTTKRCTCKVDLRGKTILITGGNTGIGFESAKILAKRGATIVIASRNVAKSTAAVQEIVDATSNPNIECKALDLSKLASVKQLADEFNKSYDRLDVLINNAGMAEKEQYLSEDRIERTHQINHVGHTYLTKLLLDKLIASKPSRIIFVASYLHKFHKLDTNDLEGLTPRSFFVRYGNAKFMNILTARALSRMLPEGVTANSLHPGLARTEIFDAGPVWFQRLMTVLCHNFCNTTEECAQTTVHLASAPSLANVTGKYFNVCNVEEPSKDVTDELADVVWKGTLKLIEDRVKEREAK